MPDSKTQLLRNLFWALLFPAACIAGNPATIVANGLEPQDRQYTLLLEENLRIGPEQDSAFIWPTVGTVVQADNQGYMYVTAAGENRVAVFNPNGSFAAYIGNPGHGPGEFRGLVSYQVLAGRRGVAFERLGTKSRWCWYDKNHRFVKSSPLSQEPATRFQKAAFSPNGALIFSESHVLDPKNRKMTISWQITGLDHQPAIKIAQFEGPLPRSRRELLENAADYLGQMLKSGAQGHIGFAAFGPQNQIYTASAHSYRITRWDKHLKKQLVITRKYKPMAQSDAEIEALIAPFWEAARAKTPPKLARYLSDETKRRAIARAEFPPQKHPISGLTVMEDGTLAVLHHVSLTKGVLAIDLFDLNGHFLGDCVLSARGAISLQLVFKNNCLYRVELNEDEEAELVRYRYKLVRVSD